MHQHRQHQVQCPPPTAITAESEQNICSVCLGVYEDDLVEGELQNEWICCTNCDQWMHLDCVSMEGNSYVCVLCNVVLK